MRRAPARLRATYRLQVHGRLGLPGARTLVPYLARLGISHAYTAPLARARSGSTHGYDAVDPGRVDPALGREADLRALARALDRHRMGLCLDIVPNHMGVGAENEPWEDVLTHGRRSPYARWFDVDWDAGGGRLVLPVLGAPLAEVLRRGELRVVRVAGRPRLRYYAHGFPLAPGTLDGIDPRDLAAVLARQHYHLVYWRRAGRDINYRRFFDIAELAGVRQEDPRVFAATHRGLLDWVRAGYVDVVRVDHVDGLCDPLQYFRRLARALARAAPRRTRAVVPIYVEKILAHDEELPTEWPVAGTTGYEFLNELEGIFVHAAGYARLEAWYRRKILGRAAGTFRAIVARSKRRVLTGPLAADVRRTVEALVAAAPRVTDERALAAALVELIVHLSVYRTYCDRRRPRGTAVDRARLAGALRQVRAERRASPAAVRALARVLDSQARPTSPAGRARLRFVERLQQLSGPAAAKGLEDTAHYVFVPLVSLNEVGGEPDVPLDDAPARLHRANAARAARWPATLLCTSTHDTKRSADARARLDALSEVAEEWVACVERWRRMHRRHRRRGRGRAMPDANTEYLCYQTVLAVWPLARRARAPRGRVLTTLRARVQRYLLKATREAKRHTSWLDPVPAFEQALAGFVDAVLRDDAPFLAEMAAFHARVARPGLWTALARTLVHLTAPGVPDVYQGDELWSFTLVDPDNREPVRFAHRAVMLRALDRALVGGRLPPARLARLVRAPEDGRVKLYLVRTVLHARARDPDLFLDGTYAPLEVTGAAAEHVFAFARRHRRRVAVVVVPRLVATLGGDPAAAPLGAACWRDTVVRLPRAWHRARLVSALTGRVVAQESGTVAVADALDVFPAALLLGRLARPRGPARRQR